MDTPISSRERSMRSFGNDGTGEGRRRRALERAADTREKLQAKRRREEKLKPTDYAHFLPGTYEHLLTLAARQMRAGKIDARRAHAILFSSVRSKRSGFVAITPKPDSAAFLATWLRSAGVDTFCQALAELDAIAGAAAPAGRAVDLPVPDLVQIAADLERTGVADAVAAAKHLRTAGVSGCHARVFVTPAAAVPIAEAVHAIGASRSLVRSLDIIAGRTEPRPH